MPHQKRKRVGWDRETQRHERSSGCRQHAPGTHQVIVPRCMAAGLNRGRACRRNSPHLSPSPKCTFVSRDYPISMGSLTLANSDRKKGGFIPDHCADCSDGVDLRFVHLVVTTLRIAHGRRCRMLCHWHNPGGFRAKLRLMHRRCVECSDSCGTGYVPGKGIRLVRTCWINSDFSACRMYMSSRPELTA